MPKKVDYFLTNRGMSIDWESLCQPENRVQDCSLVNTDCLFSEWLWGFPSLHFFLSERRSECSCTQLLSCEKVLSVCVWSHRMRHTMAFILVLNILVSGSECNMAWKVQITKGKSAMYGMYIIWTECRLCLDVKDCVVALLYPWETSLIPAASILATRLVTLVA